MWWHSGAGENNQELKRSLNTLKALEKYFSIVNVPCSLEKRLLIEQGINPVKIRIIPEGIEPLFRPSNQEEKSLNRHRLGIPQGAFCIGFFQKDGISLKIESIIYVGESMTTNLRRHLSDFFSSKIFSFNSFFSSSVLSDVL